MASHHHGSSLIVERDELVILLKLACDTSGEPLADGERKFLTAFCEDVEIGPKDGVILG